MSKLLCVVWMHDWYMLTARWGEPPVFRCRRCKKTHRGIP